MTVIPDEYINFEKRVAKKIVRIITIPILAVIAILFLTNQWYISKDELIRQEKNVEEFLKQAEASYTKLVNFNRESTKEDFMKALSEHRLRLLMARSCLDDIFDRKKGAHRGWRKDLIRLQENMNYELVEAGFEPEAFRFRKILPHTSLIYEFNWEIQKTKRNLALANSDSNEYNSYRETKFYLIEAEEAIENIPKTLEIKNRLISEYCSIYRGYSFQEILSNDKTFPKPQDLCSR